MYLRPEDFQRFDHNLIVVRRREDLEKGLTSLGLQTSGLASALLDQSGSNLISRVRCDGNTGRETNIHLLICSDPLNLCDTISNALHGLVNEGEKCLVHLGTDFFEIKQLTEAMKTCLVLGHDLNVH